MKKYTIIGISLLFASNANAICDPEKHYTPLTCNAGGVHMISPTSNYAIESKQFISDIALTGQQISTAVAEGSQAQIQSFQKYSMEMMKKMIEMNQVQLKDRLKMDKAQRELEMSYEANMAEEEARRSAAVLYKDDTKEEMKLMAKILRENPDLKTTEVIVATTNEYDMNKKTIPVPIKAAEGVCDEKKIELGYCSVQKTVTPGKKMAKLFKECNQQKRELERKKQETRSKKAAIIVNSRKTNEAISSTNAVAAMKNNLREQTKLSCTPSDYKNKLCAQGMSKEDYQEKVALNQIIPNGNISATNLLAPPYYGGEEMTKYDAATKNDLTKKALAKGMAKQEPNQSAVPVVHTYKNSNQYNAGVQFIDNITASELISNQAPRDRTKQTSSEFQSAFNKRMAVLSLVRTAFMDSMKIRTGQVLSEAISSGQDLSKVDQFNPIKEDILGASEIDILMSRVDELFSKVAVNANGGVGDSNSMDEVENGADKMMKKAQLETLKLQTEIAFKQMLENEKVELLKAAQIASIINSPEMTSYLQELRK